MILYIWKKTHLYSSVFILHHIIVVCLSTTWGINDMSQVDDHLAVFNDKRSSKSATSFSHSHSLTNWYTGYMLDDQWIYPESDIEKEIDFRPGLVYIAQQGDQMSNLIKLTIVYLVWTVCEPHAGHGYMWTPVIWPLTQCYPFPWLYLRRFS